MTDRADGRFNEPVPIRIGVPHTSISHYEDDYPDGMYRQPNKTFTHVWTFRPQCPLCVYDVAIAEATMTAAHAKVHHGGSDEPGEE